MKMFNFTRDKLKLWWKETEGLAAIEASLIFPILLMMLMGSFDAGYAILASQKTIRASQVTADLIARNRQVTDAEVDQAVEAGRLSMFPYGDESFGVDIVSIEFDEDGVAVPIWCDTRGAIARNQSALDNAETLATPGEGVVVVTVRHLYKPTFSGFVFNNFDMVEVAYARGRLSATVTHEDTPGC